MLRGIYEDRVISDMEEIIRKTLIDNIAAMPNTCHPSLTHAMDYVRELNKDHVFVAMVKPLRNLKEEVYPEMAEAFHKVLLTRKTCVGLAPFVGDPRMNEARYVWSVWVDDYGRHVAGEAELVWQHTMKS